MPGVLGSAVSGGLLILLAAAPARGATTTIAPGQDFTLAADIVLTAGDILTAGDPAGPRCKIHGGGHSIQTADPWTGTLTIASCDDYASYEADHGATTPSECDFCPAVGF